MMQNLLSQFPANNFTLLALVLALPLIGAIFNGLFGKRVGNEAVRLMALTVMAASFVVSVITFLTVVSLQSHGATADGHVAEAARVSWDAWEWFTVTGRMRQDIPIRVAFSADALSATMMLVVTGVGFLIHLYSTSYMKNDPGFTRFFAYLNLFVFSMMILILGDNLAVLFVGWEGVGLCSYLLIGFWYTDEKKAAAGKKAFITNRVGDFGLLVAMAMLLYYAGTLNFTELQSQQGAFLTQRVVWPVGNLQASALPSAVASFLTPDEPIRMHVATMVGLALFVGCAGKSAQIPLYVWLPDAMAGPTPVSALIHAATMVTAGVYLVARTSFIFVMSPAAMAVVAGTGALTALFAASIAFAQSDLKKVLAYSTVSQLGFMFIGVGVGAFGAGFFHVLTHAFFKGCLFLCAGSVIHAMHERIHDEEGSQDMRNMGGLRKFMPITHATFLISCLAIAGCPPLSGFWSKDELLWKAFSTQIKPAVPTLWVPPAWFGQAIYAIGAVAAVCTAFYMFRAYFLTFWGDFRGWKVIKGWKAPKGHHDHHHHDDHEDGPLEGPVPHESPLPMTIPLGVLAFLALTAGFLYAEPIHVAPLEHFWAPVFQKASKLVVARAGAEGMMMTMLGVGVGLFAVGAGAAFVVYRQMGGAPAKSFVEALPWLHKGARDKWYVDEAYEFTVLGMIDSMGETSAQFDKWVVDGIVARVTSGLAVGLGTLLRLLHTGRVQVYAAGMVLGVFGVGWFAFMPRAAAEVDATKVKRSGEVVFEAAPGRGYSYRWHVDGEKTPLEFKRDGKFAVTLASCETKRVHLDVKSMFGGEDRVSFEPCRETRRGCCRKPGEGGEARTQRTPRTTPGTAPTSVQLPQGKFTGKQLQDMLKNRRRPKSVPVPKGGAK